MAGLVYVYKGLGAGEVGCQQLINALREHLSSTSYKVDFISPEEIRNGLDSDKVSMISFGGGFTSGFAEALGDTGLAHLKSFVANGGAYLGFGAGGYFGCDIVEFDVGGPLEKRIERNFRLYPGIGRGPLFPGFQYGTNRGVHAALVTFNNSSFSDTFHAYIDGGGAFHLSPEPKPGSEVNNVSPLAFFQEVPGMPVAVVKTEVGNKGGRAILSGVHLEYDTMFMVDSDSSLQPLKMDFENSKYMQMKAFRSVLVELLGHNVLTLSRDVKVGDSI